MASNNNNDEVLTSLNRDSAGGGTGCDKLNNDSRDILKVDAVKDNGSGSVEAASGESMVESGAGVNDVGDGAKIASGDGGDKLVSEISPVLGGADSRVESGEISGDADGSKSGVIKAESSDSGIMSGNKESHSSGAHINGAANSILEADAKINSNSVSDPNTHSATPDHSSNGENADSVVKISENDVSGGTNHDDGINHEDLAVKQENSAVKHDYAPANEDSAITVNIDSTKAENDTKNEGEGSINQELDTKVGEDSIKHDSNTKVEDSIDQSLDSNELNGQNTSSTNEIGPLGDKHDLKSDEVEKPTNNSTADSNSTATFGSTADSSSTATSSSTVDSSSSTNISSTLETNIQSDYIKKEDDEVKDVNNPKSTDETKNETLLTNSTNVDVEMTEAPLEDEDTEMVDASVILNTNQNIKIESENVTKPDSDSIGKSNGSTNHYPENNLENLPEIAIKRQLSPQINSIESKKVKFNKPNIIVVPQTQPQLFYSPLKTGLVYDVRMRYHAKIFTLYYEYIDPHPEDPRRIYRIYKKLAEAGLINDTSLSGIDNIGNLMVKIPIREATSDEILQVHSLAHLQYIQQTENMSRDQLLEETEKGDSIYVNNDSYISAKLSCGGTIEACKAVIEGRVKNSLAIVRPPGHHAEPDTPGGFCLFSNVAVAAKNILKSYPESVRKIVIVDWDIHHGNGTQKSFIDDPRVLYISIHRYDNGRFYPGTKHGNSDQVGTGKGEGYNINIPWRTHGKHDGDYIYAFNKIILPAISEYDPDLIIVSSGFDAADGDIIGLCHVTPAGYGWMTHMLKSVAKGKLAVILEGGYNLDSISNSALGVAKVLVGEPPEETISKQPHLDTIEVVDEVIKTHSKYWNCFKYGVLKTSLDDIYEHVYEDKSHSKVINVGETIRSYQFNDFNLNQQFINLPILVNPKSDDKVFTTELPANLDEIILASPNINEAQTIIVTVQDPPEIWANINPLNGNIEPNSSIVLQHPLNEIISKVDKELGKPEDSTNGSIGYIFINIPSYQIQIPGGLGQSSNTSYNPIIFSLELLLYIWDNYLSYLSTLKKLVFVGFGESYQSIVNLYGKRPPQDIKELVKGTIAFVNRSSLKAIVPVMDESMIEWFYQNSLIFASSQNPCWSGPAGNKGTESNGPEDTSKRPRRKFGRVLKASGDGLFDVINEKFEEGVDFILDSVEDFSSSGSGN